MALIDDVGTVFKTGTDYVQNFQNLMIGMVFSDLGRLHFLKVPWCNDKNTKLSPKVGHYKSTHSHSHSLSHASDQDSNAVQYLSQLCEVYTIQNPVFNIVKRKIH